VYAVGSYLYSSTNGGASWTRGSMYIGGNAIAVDPSDTRRLYVAGYATVYVSSDYGRSLSPRSDAIEGSGEHVEIAAANPSRLYVAAYEGLYRSSDRGTIWTSAHGGVRNTRIPALAAAPSQPSRLFAEKDGCAVYASLDAGSNWARKGYFVACGNVGALAIHPHNPDIVLALEGAG
jgi:photosystem II stability/assembly factor-like uncharacterized protein